MQTKGIQGKLWSRAPSDWVKHLEPTFIPLYQAVLNKVPLDEKKMLLDSGCGAGLFLSMAATTGASIHGIDAAPGLLSVSRKRLTDATLLHEDLEAIPFSDETFDVVTGFNSFQYAGSFENALSEARRVTKKHGKVVIGIWGKEQDCDPAMILRAVDRLLPPPPPGTPSPYALSEDGKIEALCEAVGLHVVEKQTVFCPWQFFGDDALLRAFLCSAACVEAVQVLGESLVRTAILKSARPFNLADDIYFLRNDVTFFITEK